MKNMKINILLGSLVAASVLGLAGCAGGSDGQVASTQQTDVIAVEDTASEATENTDVDITTDEEVPEDNISENIVSDENVSTEDSIEDNTENTISEDIISEDIISEDTEIELVSFEGSCFVAAYNPEVWEDIYQEVKKGGIQEYELMLGHVTNYSGAILIASKEIDKSQKLDCEVVKNQLELQLENNDSITLESCENVDFKGYDAVKAVMVMENEDIKKKSETYYIMVRRSKLAISYTDNYDSFDEYYPDFQRFMEDIEIKRFL